MDVFYLKREGVLTGLRNRVMTDPRNHKMSYLRRSYEHARLKCTKSYD